MKLNPKGAGRNEKPVEEKAVRTNIMLPPVISERLKSLPKYKRSKFTAQALELYFGVLDGKVSIITKDEKLDNVIRTLIQDKQKMV